MGKKYVWIRVDKEAKEKLDERLKRINEFDLKNYGKKVKQIDFTNFLFKTNIFISDKELKGISKRWKGRRF